MPYRHREGPDRLGFPRVIQLLAQQRSVQCAGSNRVEADSRSCQCACTAVRRTQRINAILEVPYAIDGATGPNQRIVRVARSRSLRNSARTAR